MVRSWMIKDCPLCNGTGKKDGTICLLCYGEKKLYVRWNRSPEINKIIDPEELAEGILDLFREHDYDDTEDLSDVSAL